MKNRNLAPDDNWGTPPELYDKLNDEFKFNFDPCPYNDGEIINDGLSIEWGSRCFINPPYSRKLKEAFVKRAVEHSRNGNLCVMLLPVSTSTALYHDIIKPNAKEIRWVRGRIRFRKKDENGEWYTPKNSGMHDSMIVVFGEK